MQIASMKKAKDYIESLPLETKEIVLSAYGVKNDRTQYLVQNMRYAADYAKAIEGTKKQIEGLPKQERIKKSETVEKYTLATKEFNIYSDAPGVLTYVFNEPLVLHNGPLSIDYGRVMIRIQFRKPVRGNRLSVTGVKGWSLDKNELVHPHLAGTSNFCLGDFPSHMEREYGKGNFHALGMLIWKYLNTYNAASPLVSWAECTERMKDGN
jgi:hypothetical protein